MIYWFAAMQHPVQRKARSEFLSQEEGLVRAYLRNKVV